MYSSIFTCTPHRSSLWQIQCCRQVTRRPKRLPSKISTASAAAALNAIAAARYCLMPASRWQDKSCWRLASLSPSWHSCCRIFSFCVHWNTTSFVLGVYDLHHQQETVLNGHRFPHIYQVVLRYIRYVIFSNFTLELTIKSAALWFRQCSLFTFEQQ